MVYLREVKIEDSEALFEICKNENITKYLTWNPHKNLEETKFVISNFFIHNKNDRPNSFVIVETLTEEVVGVIDILDGRINNQLKEIGYFIKEEKWGLGYATVALKLILKIAFDNYNYNKIGISHMIENIGSEKVILKNNFKFIKEVDSTVKNNIVKQKYYELERSDFNE